MRTPRKPFAAAGGMYGGAVAGGGMMPSDLAAAAGTPSNLGKIGDAGTSFLSCNDGIATASTFFQPLRTLIPLA